MRDCLAMMRLDFEAFGKPHKNTFWQKAISAISTLNFLAKQVYLVLGGIKLNAP